MPKKVTMSVDGGPEVDVTKAMQDTHDIETIRTYARDIEELAAKKKVAKERLAEIEAGWGITAEIEELQEKLAELKNTQKTKRQTSHEYVNQTEVIAGITRDEAEAKEILSDYLVNHYVNTHEKQVLMNEANGDAREINIKASLGKETKYQTSLDMAG